MGIPPYQTPEERQAMQEHLAHYHNFLKENGYKDCYTINPNNSTQYLPRKGFKTSDGTYYETAEEMYQGHGFYPALEKDGICYSYYKPQEIHGYVEPFVDELAFLEHKGYLRVWPQLRKDYADNNTAYAEFYKMNGFLPRWEKDNRWFGHVELLKEHSYKYIEWKNEQK